jgi:hypothetical protein
MKQKSGTASVAAVLNSLQTTGVAITTKAGDAAGGAVKRINVQDALTFPPSGLAATAASTSSITLNWTDNSSDETQFRIERSPTGASGTYAQIDTAAANTTSYPNSGLAEGTTYYSRVRAYNGSTTSAYSNETSATSPLSAPSGLAATAASASQINLTWTDHSGAETGFSIERSTTSGAGYALVATAGANATAYSDTGLSASATYYYRVRAYNSSVNSAYSNEASATTPAAPAASAGGGGGGGGGCFIATAAYGSAQESQVLRLRAFRDRFLLTHPAGRAFVRLYYAWSPPLARFIAPSDGLRFLTRCALLPLVGLACLLLTLGAKATGLLLLTLLLLLGALYQRRCRQQRPESSPGGRCRTP